MKARPRTVTMYVSTLLPKHLALANPNPILQRRAAPCQIYKCADSQWRTT